MPSGGVHPITNLLDSRVDSFATGNPFSIRIVPQFTPLAQRSADRHRI
ncbi:MAG: hypothetical protein U1E68_02260 [Sphingomonadaceae bacterium]|jgi:hypothetical protein